MFLYEIHILRKDHQMGTLQSTEPLGESIFAVTYITITSIVISS